jgi:hypothetical protein
MNQTPVYDQDFVPTPANQPLSQETLKSLRELGEIFRRIHHRLVSEGYTIQDGKIIPPASGTSHGKH